LKDFNVAADTKVQEIQELVADHKEAANVALADLRGHTATAKRVLNEMDRHLTDGAAELKKYRDKFIEERQRLEEARARYENQKDWRDWVVFGILLLSMVVIGACIEAKWPLF
jgi:hypothetical protein